jgi:Ca2+-binding EF-hand superfamily protein
MTPDASRRIVAHWIVDPLSEMETEMTTAAMDQAAVDQVLELRFKNFDTNRDGRIDRLDFKQEAIDIIRALGEELDSPHARALIDSYVTLYDYIARKAGVDDEGFSSAVFLTAFKTVIIDRGDVGFHQVVRPAAYAVAALCDPDGDGKISPEEFSKCFTAVGGATGVDTEESFKQIDVDNDGIVSIDEFVEAVKRYFFGGAHLKLLG